MMKKLSSLVVIALSIAIFKPLNAQDSEIGLYLGISNYMGDLERNRLNTEVMHPAFGALYRYYFNPGISFKANVYYGNISGDDAFYADQDITPRLRNLSFKSHILEASVQMEWNILPFVPGSQKYRFSPYVFGGISVFNFNPKAELNGEWHELQPLGTEGQNIYNDMTPYALTQIAIPMGAGIKYNISGMWNIGFKIGARKTFTDYLDDVSSNYADNDLLRAQAGIGNISADLADRREVGNFREGSQRGNPNAMDWYGFSGFTITKTIRTYTCY